MRYHLLILLFIASSLNAQISVDTLFEGGNARVLQIDNAGNTLKVESVLRRGDIYNVVFYFKVNGIDSTRLFNLKIKYAQQYFTPALLAYSYDNVNWYRFSGTFSGDSKIFSQVFTRRSVYFSHGYPYLYSRLAELQTQYSGNPNVSFSNIAVSELGRAVKLFRFTNPNVNDSGKYSVWILGRNHAMETHSNFVVEGLMNFLASSDQKAEYLRTKAIVYIVPIMDVDMAALGGTGKDQNPVDFNRDWDSPSYWNAVKSVKAEILRTAALNRIKLFIDSHNPFPGDADTTTRLFFFSLHESGIKSANLNTFRSFLFQNGGYTFQRKPLYPTSGQTSSRWVDSMLTYIDFSASLETGWIARTDGSTWTKHFYMKNGEILGKGISDYMYHTSPVIEHNEAMENTSIVYPNPINNSSLKFSIQEQKSVTITIYDINGREIYKETPGMLGRGTYSIRLRLEELSSGVHFYAIRSTGGILLHKGKFIYLK